VAVLVSGSKLKVMSAGAVEGPVRALAPAFTQASGIGTEISFNTVGALRDQFVGGERPDVLLLSVPAIEALEKEGRFVAGSRALLGHATCGVAVRDGMLPPDVSTVEGFQRMLKFAGSIAANDPAHGGSSGIYLFGLLERLGVLEAVRPKLVLCKTGRECAFALLQGRAEVGITFTSEFIAVPGTRVVGPLPKEYEYVNGYAGAIPAGAALEPARAFLDFLTNAAGRARFKDFGLE
jgi:molybdate transport system substrate-binding protein